MVLDELTAKAKIVILYASAYDMITEEREHLVGCTVHYLFWGKDGERLLTQSEWNVEKPVGVQRAKVSLQYADREKIVCAPALYEGTFEMKVGGDGKPVAVLVDAAYICNVEIKPKFVDGLVIPGMVTPPASGSAESVSGKDAKTAK